MIQVGALNINSNNINNNNTTNYENYCCHLSKWKKSRTLQHNYTVLPIQVEKK